MLAELPAGFRFVSELEFTTEEADTLRNKAVEAVDLDNIVPLANEDIADSADFSTREKDKLRPILGVCNSEGTLIAYAGATLDTSSGHATVECLVVDPLERSQGVGTALADTFCRLLDSKGAEAISFQPFCEVGWLLPYLQEQQGFTYSWRNKEYTSHRDPPEVTPESLGFIMPSLALNPTASGNQPEAIYPEEAPLDELEIGAFKSVVEELVQKAITHAAENHWAVSAWDAFQFEIAGRKFTVSQRNLKRKKSWHITESDVGEVISTDRGLQETLSRQYRVTQDTVNAPPGTPTFRQRVIYLDPKRPNSGNSDIEVLPFNFARLSKLVGWLDRLDPAQHLVREPEPLAGLKPSKHIEY